MELDDLRKREHDLKNGQAGAFWKEIRQLLYGQNIACKMGHPVLSKLDDAFEVARLQGKMEALQLAMSLPDILLEDVRAEIQAAIAADQEIDHGANS